MIFRINTRRTNFQKGFMLTEVLITTVIIVIAMVGVLPLLFSGVKSAKVSKIRATMTSIAQKEVESFNQSTYTILSKKYPTNYSDIQAIYVNPTNGQIDSTAKNGFKKVVIFKTYTYINGEPTPSDDIIELLVKVQIDGDVSKPVTLLTSLSRDKI